MSPDKEHPELTCAMTDKWPPIHAKVYGPDPELVRNLVEPVVYQRLRTWHLACGLLEMDGSATGKCQSCPHARINGRPLVQVNPRIPASPAARSRDIKPVRKQ